MNEEIYQSPSASSEHTTSLLSAVNKKLFLFFRLRSNGVISAVCILYFYYLI